MRKNNPGIGNETKISRNRLQKDIQEQAGLQIRVCIGKLFSLFLIQNMLWVLKRTVSMRRFF